MWEQGKWNIHVTVRPPPGRPEALHRNSPTKEGGGSGGGRDAGEWQEIIGDGSGRNQVGDDCGRS